MNSFAIFKGSLSNFVQPFKTEQTTITEPGELDWRLSAGIVLFYFICLGFSELLDRAALVFAGKHSVGNFYAIKTDGTSIFLLLAFSLLINLFN